MLNRLIKRLQSKWIKGNALFILTFALISGCGPAEEQTAYPNGDPAGDLFLAAVVNRFEDGLNLYTATGKEIYTQYCVICHGASGDGSGFNAYNLKSNFNVQPFNFTDPAAVEQASLEEIKTAIKKGGVSVNKSQYMPPWGRVLSEYELVCIFDYVRHLSTSGQGE